MLSAPAIRKWYLVHKWTSLICTLFLLMLCVTGLPLIFYHEIDHALGYSVDPPVRPGVTSTVSVDQIVEAARVRKPEHFVQYASRDPDEPNAWFVAMGATANAPEPSAFYMFDARTGEYLHEYPLQQGVMYVLFRLHYDMFTGLPGSLFLGVMGMLLVASLTVAANLFPAGDAVGQQVQLRNVPFRVVGVLAAKGQTASGADQDDVVLVPYTTARNRLSGWARVQQILASTYSPSDIPAAQEEMRAILRESHRLGVDDDDDFTVRNQDELAEAASGTTKVMSWLLAAIASISLLVGGIGIMNIMLVSVTERISEIGIRMAVGARPRDVMAQFLTEALVVCFAGGLIGIALGIAGGYALTLLGDWRMVLGPQPIVLAFTCAFLTGVIFGFLPARQAASLAPVDALARE